LSSSLSNFFTMSSPAVIDADVLNDGFKNKPNLKALVSLSFPSSVFLGKKDLKNFTGGFGSVRPVSVS